MSISSATHRTYSFGDFTLDIDRGALLSAGTEIKLRPKSFHVLTYLVERHGILASKDELIDAVWGRTAVSDDSLTHCLIDIRRALNDTEKSIIRTVPTRGFIFDATVSFSSDDNGTKNEEEIGAKRFIWLASSVSAAIVVAAIFWWVAAYDRQSEQVAPLQSIISLAVVPFIDMSAQQDQQYFGDGIAEDLLTVLAKIPQLQVISRTSSFSFRGKGVDIPTIAKQLGVSHILEGSVRKDGDTIRVNAQLIDVQTDTHIWSETYDRNLEDVFAVQDEISAAVVTQLELALVEPPARSESVDTRAYTLALRARYLLNQYDPENFPDIELLLQQALDINPDYVVALTELARLYVHEGGSGLRTQEEAAALFHEVIHRANQIEPNNGVVHIYLGFEPIIFNDDIRSGAAHIERAMQLGPTNLFVVQWAQDYAARIGRLDLVKTLGLYIVARDPLCLQCKANLARSYELTGEYDKAETLFSTIAMVDSSSFLRPRYHLGMIKLLSGDAAGAITEFQSEEDSVMRSVGLSLAYYDLNRMAEFETEFEKIRKLGDADNLVAGIHAWSGNIDIALDLLEKEVANIPGAYRTLFQQSLYRDLHGHPRWIRLLNETGTSPKQLASIEFDPPLPQ